MNLERLKKIMKAKLITNQCTLHCAFNKAKEDSHKDNHLKWNFENKICYIEMR